MKKNFKWLMVLIIAFMVFIPAKVLADDENGYEYFDFKVDKVIGEKIKDTTITIFASLTGDENNLIDRTEEFNLSEVMWSVCVETDCATSEEVTDDAVFEEGKDYILMVIVTAKNGAPINVWGTDRAKYNGTPIEELSGEFGNTGNELMIKTRTSVHVAPTPTPEPTKEPTPTPKEKQDDNKDKCLFGLSFCCTTLLGLSICIWIIIAIILILLIIVLVLLKSKKKEEPGQDNTVNNSF